MPGVSFALFCNIPTILLHYLFIYSTTKQWDIWFAHSGLEVEILGVGVNMLNHLLPPLTDIIQLIPSDSSFKMFLGKGLQQHGWINWTKGPDILLQEARTQLIAMFDRPCWDPPIYPMEIYQQGRCRVKLEIPQNQ